MDERPETPGRDPVALTGFGCVLSTPCDPVPYLRVRKNRKFMGEQDKLAVVAAGRALESAGLLGAPLGERAGLFLAVGHIPFEGGDIDRLLGNSIDENGFSMERFSTVGCTSVNPLLTFRCLSNMPAFHISVNFDIQGPYFVTYPGPGQFYAALEQAVGALAAGRVDIALVAGVAHQRNFLVEHHFSRLYPPVPLERLRDAAGCLVLETGRRSASARGRLLEWDITYRPHHPFEETPVSNESAEGPASLPLLLCRSRGKVRHAVESLDGIMASSLWEIA